MLWSPVVGAPAWWTLVSIPIAFWATDQIVYPALPVLVGAALSFFAVLGVYVLAAVVTGRLRSGGRRPGGGDGEA